ncbi:MAG: hypothetical protein ACOYMR_04255 [Ilumatobacteraceae bacterium]
MTSTSPVLENPNATPRRGRTWVKVVLAVLCAAMAWMWIYYFFFATEEGVYQIEDPTWRPQAKEICAAAQAQREQLADMTDGFITDPTPEQMAQRGQLADEATDIIEQMLDKIVAIPVANEKDRVRLDFFEENYRIVIADRRRYAAALKDGQLVNYTETVVGGGPVSNVVSDFTAGVKGNDVPACTPPGELGGDIRT